jgi:SPP1 family predicted phage head-tail adaptor
MEIGRLNQRVQIQAYKETQQLGSAFTNKEWTTIKTVWCLMEPVKGLVQIDTAQVDKGVTAKVIMRYQPYITTEHWLYMQGRRFRIRTVRNLDEVNRFLELLCEEVYLAVDGFEVDQSAVGDALNELG